MRRGGGRQGLVLGGDKENRCWGDKDNWWGQGTKGGQRYRKQGRQGRQGKQERRMGKEEDKV